MKTNVQESKTLRSGNAHELCDNLCFRSQCSLSLLTHVRLATSAQRMSGLHVFSFSGVSVALFSV